MRGKADLCRDSRTDFQCHLFPPKNPRPAAETESYIGGAIRTSNKENLRIDCPKSEYIVAIRFLRRV